MTRLAALGVPAALVLGCGTVAVPAHAASPTPSSPETGFSAVWQYVEEVPSASGPALEQGGTKAVAVLPAHVQHTLSKSISSGSTSSATDRVLRKVGTLAAYGAPITVSPVRLRPVLRHHRPASHAQSAVTQAALVGSSTSWFDPRTILLLLLLVGTMALALARRLTGKELVVVDPVATAERERRERDQRRLEREAERSRHAP
jgi:hypothetical protein